MMSGAGSLPQGIQKKSKCPRIQVLFLGPSAQLGYFWGSSYNEG